MKVDDDGPGVVVSVGGELDSYTAPRLGGCLSDILDRGQRRVVIDLEKTSFIEARGLSVLVGTMRRLRSQGGDLVLRSPSRSSYRLLEITGLTKVMRIV